MGRKSKHSKELKLSIVKRYLDGEGSYESLTKEINVYGSTVESWVKKYKSYGEIAFDLMKKNNSFTKEFKEQVILDYLNGGGSYFELSLKYTIPSNTTIQVCFKDNNSHIELKNNIPGGEDIYMAKSRKVDKNGRIKIVKYCLEYDLDYKTTAKVFETSYANVFNWVKKYKEKGEDGLGDKRARHKTDEEVDEVTLFKRQLKLKQKKHELEIAQLEIMPHA